MKEVVYKLQLISSPLSSGQPTPIEYLPAEHTLDSRVRLVIKYQGRPTSTIAVGDPLEFKLETQVRKRQPFNLRRAFKRV